MKQAGRSPLHVAIGLAGILLAAGLSGCADAPIASVTPLQEMTFPGHQTATLSADDVVRVMWRAGFSDDQILEVGTDLRNSLAYTGAAQIVVGETVEAVFGMDGDYLYVASRMRGSFIYDLVKRDLR